MTASAELWRPGTHWFNFSLIGVHLVLLQSTVFSFLTIISRSVSKGEADDAYPERAYKFHPSRAGIYSPSRNVPANPEGYWSPVRTRAQTLRYEDRCQSEIIEENNFNDRR